MEPRYTALADLLRPRGFVLGRRRRRGGWPLLWHDRTGRNYHTVVNRLEDVEAVVAWVEGVGRVVPEESG